MFSKDKLLTGTLKSRLETESYIRREQVMLTERAILSNIKSFAATLGAQTMKDRRLSYVEGRDRAVTAASQQFIVYHEMLLSVAVWTEAVTPEDLERTQENLINAVKSLWHPATSKWFDNAADFERELRDALQRHEDGKLRSVRDAETLPEAE